MPADMTFEDAAAVPDGAYQGLLAMRAGDVREGKRVLVYGASGSCGTACVRLARYYGAHVTAVCNTKNVDLMRSLGADEVIDYTREDFAPKGQAYDVFIDAVGKRRSFLRNRRFLEPGGVFVPTDGLQNIALAPLASRFGKRRMRFDYSRPKKDDLLFVKQLLEEGHYRPVVDRVYPLDQPSTHTAMSTPWQKTGNVVLIATPRGTRRHEGRRPRPLRAARGAQHREVEDPLPQPHGARTGPRLDRDADRLRVRAADPFFSRVFTGLRRPKRKIVGLELAGVVEAVGDEVTEFAVGDRVFGLRGGANAELVCVREHGALAHPQGTSFEEAAPLSDGPSIAQACLRKARSATGGRF